IPQGEFERTPEALGLIRAAEREKPAGGPFRVHVMPRWVPIGWARRSPPGRSADLARWERDALRPGYGLPFGVSYTLAGTSSLEREEFAGFSRPYTMRLAPSPAAGIGAEPGQRVLCYPRQAFDLWATRYFILPTDPADWAQGNRAFLTFLDRTEPVYP